MLPLLLIIFGIVCAAAAVYGVMPQWMLYDHGLQIIEMSRRLQWPLFTIAALLSLALVVMVISGKRRAWWLVGLAPIVALFVQQFVTGTMSDLRVIEQPPLVNASDARFVPDDDYVVGLYFNDRYYAFPYRQLFHSPVVVFGDRDKRMILMWSAFGNRAQAFQVSRQIKARELDIVSMPANALLLYNSRVGQFINAFTATTDDGQLPSGFGATIHTIKTPWRNWRTLHPQTLVMAMPTVSTALGVPVSPQFPMRSTTRMSVPAVQPVVLVGTTRPTVIDQSAIGDQLLNVVIGETPAIVFRDGITGKVRVFNSEFDDRFSRFLLNWSPRRAARGVFMLDVETNSGWTAAGVAVDGDAKIIGTRLTPMLDVDEDIYWGVAKQWYPELELPAGNAGHVSDAAR